MPKSRLAEKLLHLLTVFPFFFTPLLLFTHSRDQFELPKLTFLILLAVPLLLLLPEERATPSWTPLSYSLLFFMGTQLWASLPFTSLSWRTSLWGDYDNFSGLSTLLTYGIWFWALSRLLNGPKIEKIFFFISLSALLSSLYAVSQHLGFDFIPWNPESVNASREFASMGNPNFLSAFLAMALPLFLCVFLKPLPGDREPGGFRGHPWRMVAPGLLLIGLGLFCTGSRGGFLASLGGLLLWIFLVFRQKAWNAAFQSGTLSRPALLPSVLSLVLGLGVLFYFGHGFLARLWDSLTHLGESLAVSRLHIWRPALDILKANPFDGTGLDTFKIAFPYYSGIGFNLIDGMFTSSRMAHNELLQIAATTGFLGLAAYLGLLLSFGVMWWRIYRSADPQLRWLLIGLLASSVAYHIQNLFSFGVAALNLVWFASLAAVQALYRKNPGVHPSTVTPAVAGWGWKRSLILLLALGVLLFPLRRLGADIAFGRGNAVSEFLKKRDPRIPPETLVEYSDLEIRDLLKSASLFPMEVKYQLYLGLAFEQRAPMDPDHPGDWWRKALACYQRAEEMSPANAYYYNDEGRIDDALGAGDPRYLQMAEEAFRMAVHWAPSSPYFSVNWALALEKAGKSGEAREELQRAFALSPFFTSKVLAQMAFEVYRKGDKARAFQLIDRAVEGCPSSAESLYCRGILFLSEGRKKRARADFQAVKNLHPTPEKNPSIQSLDLFLQQTQP